MPVRRQLLVLTAALLTACSSTTARVDDSGPAPENGQPGPTPAGTKVTGLVYRPATPGGYKLERHDSLTFQYPGGAVQQQVRDRIAFVHVTVGAASGATSYPVTIVLDSLQALENGQQADSAFAVRGTRWTATLTQDGALSQLQADRGGTLSDELSGRLRLFFPRLPAEGARGGMEWTDSSEYKLVADAFPGAEKQVTTYRASEGPKKGLTLESDGSYSRTGTQQKADQVLEMSGTGKRHATHQINGDGVLVSAHGNDSGDMTISVPAVGQTVPVKQSGSYSITQSPPR